MSLRKCEAMRGCALATRRHDVKAQRRRVAMMRVMIHVSPSAMRPKMGLGGGLGVGWWGGREWGIGSWGGYGLKETI